MTMWKQLWLEIPLSCSGAAQHEVMRCRAGAHLSTNAAASWIPALRSNAPRCSASGTREPLHPL